MLLPELALKTGFVYCRVSCLFIKWIWNNLAQMFTIIRSKSDVNHYHAQKNFIHQGLANIAEVLKWAIQGHHSPLVVLTSDATFTVFTGPSIQGLRFHLWIRILHLPLCDRKCDTYNDSQISIGREKRSRDSSRRCCC